MGVTPVESVSGFRYYVVFVDHFSCFTWLYLLTHKSVMLAKFVLFKAMVENKFSTKIKTLRSDGGGEYTSHLNKYLVPTHLNKMD